MQRVQTHQYRYADHLIVCCELERSLRGCQSKGQSECRATESASQDDLEIGGSEFGRLLVLYSTKRPAATPRGLRISFTTKLILQWPYIPDNYNLLN
jgi:hypothetical protein